MNRYFINIILSLELLPKRIIFNEINILGVSFYFSCIFLVYCRINNQIITNKITRITIKPIKN